jgi:hypothetical protein
MKPILLTFLCLLSANGFAMRWDDFRPSTNVEDRRYASIACNDLQYAERISNAEKDLKWWREMFHRAIGADSVERMNRAASCKESQARSRNLQYLQKSFYKAIPNLMTQIDMVRFCQRTSFGIVPITLAKRKAEYLRKDLNALADSFEQVKGSNSQLEASICSNRN